MKEFLVKISSFLLAFLVLISTFSFTVDSHYCGDFLIEVSFTGEIKSKNFVICDDICDGGRTFIEIAKAIRNIRPEEVFGDNIYLVVTHSIFSAGFEELEKWFTGIYTTNSVKDIDNELVTQINVF